jgi:hypothetical protein
MGEPMHYRSMFGFHDHTSDPRNGRPLAHYSWAGETIVTWTTWVLAAVSLCGALAFYLKWQDLDGPMQMALASVLFAGMAYWRHNMLIRKRAALRDAVKDYEAMLIKPFG